MAPAERQAPPARTGRRRRRWLWSAAAAALLRSADAVAALYLPGPVEADPPTGDLGPRAVEPDHGAAAESNGGAAAEPNGNGVRWTLAPIRYGGTLSLDGRWLRLDDGSRSSQLLLFNDIEFATYVWQPWFVQLRAGLGLLASRDQQRDADSDPSLSRAYASTGRFQLSVFPASRFPFELRAEVSDSRVSGETLGTDYRSHRLSLSQSYRPETGNQSYSLSFDRSRVRNSRGESDTLDAWQATATQQFNDQSLEFAAMLSDNERDDSGERSRLATLTARHSFHPDSAWNVDTLASWNALTLRGGGGDPFDVGSDIRQISSFATYRPREGDALYSASSPLYLTGSARLVDAGSESGGIGERAQAVNATLGLSQDLSRAWRLAASVSGSAVSSSGRSLARAAAANASASWTPEPLELGDWRYAPTLGFTTGATRATSAGERITLGAQASHGVSRDWPIDEGESVSLNLTQSVATVHESARGEDTHALAHSASLYWQSGGGGQSQGFAGASASDARTWGSGNGRFQLVNLQLSRRLQVSRHASWSGHLTWQASRSDTTLIDPFDGLPREQSPGWQRFYSGALAYENQRVFGVPRLRHTLLLSVNSQQIERRAAGDIDAPLERITESIESRLDYTIGRLEARLSARSARIEGRTVTSILARVQRRY